MIGTAKTALKLAFCLVASLILYRWGHDYATAWRGYEAIGGEILLPLLPWLAYLRR